MEEIFDISTIIGKGNFSFVNIVSRKNDDKKYAMKTIRKLKLDEKSIVSTIIFLTLIFQAFLLDEIDVLRAIDHPNVISLVEVYESERRVHLILPYYSGGELFDRIKDKVFYKERDAVLVMKSILSGLEYLERKRIVHRDLKPENLILKSKDNDYDLVIADFGLATFLPSCNTLKEQKCGSLGFIAPEMLNNQEYNCKANMFSAGAIMYQILTGRMAFGGFNSKEV